MNINNKINLKQMMLVFDFYLSIYYKNKKLKLLCSTLMFLTPKLSTLFSLIYIYMFETSLKKKTIFYDICLICLICMTRVVHVSYKTYTSPHSGVAKTKQNV